MISHAAKPGASPTSVWRADRARLCHQLQERNGPAKPGAFFMEKNLPS